MQPITTFEWHKAESPEHAVLVLPGISGDITSSFMQKLTATARKSNKSVLAINLPHHDGIIESPSEGLVRELEALHSALSFLKEHGATHIDIAAKSLGAVIVSRYLSDQDDPTLGPITIFGAVVDDLSWAAFKEHAVSVIQGENDRFGDASAVMKAAEAAGITLHNCTEIAGADHSYRNIDGQPAFEDEAVSYLRV